MTSDFSRPDYANAVEDFHSARRKAVVSEILARLRGKSTRMIPYEEVRKHFGGLESAKRELKEIPLDAIVGTVSRYRDFSRSLLPLSAMDQVRWVNVRSAVDGQMGLPPIEVYQVGEVYFILDGHHRASVAREIGATHIQAYVREVAVKVPLSPTDEPNDIILKAEYSDFLAKTHFDVQFPNVSLKVTAPGEYEKLIEHISVHRYFQGIDENRPIPYDEALAHWYVQVYMPIARFIRQRNILKDFPGRTETDLYLFIMEHRTGLQDELGWQVSPVTAANDLLSRYSPRLYSTVRRVIANFLRLITPDQLEPSPPPGAWRQRHLDESGTEQGLFGNILLAVTGDSDGWRAVDQALAIARSESSFVGGLHLRANNRISTEQSELINRVFTERCVLNGVNGALAVEEGNITKSIYAKSFWADLLVLRLSHPPPFLSLKRLRSGLRDLIRLCSLPVLVVPPSAVLGPQKVLLAYGGGRKADEAMYIAAYMAKRWGVGLYIVTVARGDFSAAQLATKARNYFNLQGVDAVHYYEEMGDPAAAILRSCTSASCDLILMGGYEGGYLREIIFGSTVDRVLSETHCSVMICT